MQSIGLRLNIKLVSCKNINICLSYGLKTTLTRSARRALFSLSRFDPQHIHFWSNTKDNDILLRRQGATSRAPTSTVFQSLFQTFGHIFGPVMVVAALLAPKVWSQTSGRWSWAMLTWETSNSKSRFLEEAEKCDQQFSEIPKHEIAK